MSLRKPTHSGVDGRKEDWGTPQSLFDRYHAEFNFLWDVCASEHNYKLPGYWDEKDDALTQDWAAKKRVWCNPPYGRGTTGKWVHYAYQQYLRGALVALLVPASTGTTWYHNLVKDRARVDLLPGRLHFEGPDRQPIGPADFDAMVVIYQPPPDPWSKHHRR